MAESPILIYIDRLYSNSIQLCILVSSVVEKFKVVKCRMIMTLRNSQELSTELQKLGSRQGQEGSSQQKTSVDQAESMIY